MIVYRFNGILAGIRTQVRILLVPGFLDPADRWSIPSRKKMGADIRRTESEYDDSEDFLRQGICVDVQRPGVFNL